MNTSLTRKTQALNTISNNPNVKLAQTLTSLTNHPEGSMQRVFNHFDVAATLIDLPIYREGIQVSDFQIPTSDEFATAQSADPELKKLRLWMDEHRTPSTDELALLSSHLICLAQIRDETSLHDGVIVFRRADDPERELILVLSSLTERVFHFFHESPGGAYQTAKATSAKVI